MATDLSDLSELEPAATDPTVQGDDEIRKTRLHLKNWAGVQHHPTGQHKFPIGAAPPAAGFLGNLFLQTTAPKHVTYDNGSAYTMLHTTPFEKAFTAGDIAIAANPTYTTVQSITLNIPTGADVMFFFGMATFLLSFASLSTMISRMRFSVDGTPAGNSGVSSWATELNLQTFTRTTFGYITSPASGARTIILEANHTNASAGALVSNRLLAAFAF